MTERPDDPLLRTLQPYRDSLPASARLSRAGLLSREHGSLIDEVLPPEIAARVHAGEFSPPVIDTRSYPLHPDYLAQTLRHAAAVRLDRHEDLAGYVAGLPFPLIELEDPDAGIKLAWNLRYRSLGGDSEELRVAWTTLAGGTIEDTQTMRTWRLRLSRRCILSPPALAPNPLDLYEVMVNEITDPPALRGWHSASYRYNDPRKGDDTWVYAPPRVKALRSDYRAEDGYGYHGSVHGQRWRYLGERVVLAGVGVPAGVAEFGGHHGWYPVSPHQLRRTHVLEATSKDPAHHYPRRVFYIDAELWMPVYTIGFDSRGECFKLVFHLYGDPAHSPWNPGHVGPINLGGVAIDLQRQHATLLPNTEQRFNHDVSKQPFIEAALAGRAPADARYAQREGFRWIAIGHTAEIVEVVPRRLYRAGLPDARALEREGIDVVVNLSGRNPTDLQHTAAGRLHVYWPIEDDELPDEALLHSLSGWVAALLRETGKKVLVHCVASVNRSNLVIGCILHEYLGLSGTALIKHLEDSNEGYAVLTNRAFRDYLLHLGSPEEAATETPAGRPGRSD